MSVAIRLKRIGRNHIKDYRIVVEDSNYTGGGRTLTVVGSFNPDKKPYKLNLDMDLIKEWVKKGASMSPRVKSLLKAQQIKI